MTSKIQTDKTCKIDNETAFKFHRDILPDFSFIYDPILASGLFSYVGYFRNYPGGRYLFPMGSGSEILKNYIANVTSNGLYYSDQFRRLKNFSIAAWPKKNSCQDKTMQYLLQSSIGGGVFLEKTGLFYSRAQIIEAFLENAERYLNTPESSTLIYDIQNYRNSLKTVLQNKSNMNNS